MQQLRHVVLLGLSAWIMDCVLEEVLFLDLPVLIKHGPPQSVPNIAPMVCSFSSRYSCNDGTILTSLRSE